MTLLSLTTRSEVHTFYYNSENMIFTLKRHKNILLTPCYVNISKRFISKKLKNHITEVLGSDITIAKSVSQHSLNEQDSDKIENIKQKVKNINIILDLVQEDGKYYITRENLKDILENSIKQNPEVRDFVIFKKMKLTINIYSVIGVKVYRNIKSLSSYDHHCLELVYQQHNSFFKKSYKDFSFMKKEEEKKKKERQKLKKKEKQKLEAEYDVVDEKDDLYALIDTLYEDKKEKPLIYSISHMDNYKIKNTLKKMIMELRDYAGELRNALVQSEDEKEMIKTTQELKDVFKTRKKIFDNCEINYKGPLSLSLWKKLDEATTVIISKSLTFETLPKIVKKSGKINEIIDDNDS